MFNWLKKLFGSDVPDTPEIAKVQVKEEVKAKPATTKKTTAKKASVDLDSMTKKELLALCKEKGIKANASLKRDEIVARLNG